MGILKRPHDKLVKETLSDPETAKDFLRQYLPADLLQLTDLETLSLEKDTFIDPKMRESFSDLLFKTAINGRTGYLYFLLEHKSSPSPQIALQLLQYMVGIWTQKSREQALLPVIIPLVLYHGRGRWETPLNLSGIIDGADSLPAAVQAHIPDYTYRLYDLSPYGAEEIKGRQKLRIFLELLAKTRWQDLEHFRSALEKIFVIFHELEQDDPEEALTYLETIIIYIMNVREDITLPDIIDQAAQISTEGRERMMTLAEKLFQEGMEKGLTEGMESERRKIVQNLLAAGFDAGKVAQAADLPLEEVMRLKKELG